MQIEKKQITTSKNLTSLPENNTIIFKITMFYPTNQVARVKNNNYTRKKHFCPHKTDIGKIEGD